MRPGWGSPKMGPGGRREQALCVSERARTVPKVSQREGGEMPVAPRGGQVGGCSKTKLQVPGAGGPGSSSCRRHVLLGVAGRPGAATCQRTGGFPPRASRLRQSQARMRVA